MPKKTTMDSIQVLVDAIDMHKKQYNSGDTDYSVTTLINPPRIVHLEKRYMSKVETFVFDNLSSFIGTGIHNYFEELLPQVPYRQYMVENRVHTTILGRKISGAYDILNKFDMTDIKTCSTWKYIKGDKDDWTAQQNMYRLLCYQKHGVEITSLSILAIFLDWTLYKMMQSGKDYPRQKAINIPLDVWDFRDTEEYMERRVQLMKENEGVADDDLPPCSHSDMWADDDTYAVKRLDRQRALRVLPTFPGAQKWLDVYVRNDKNGVKLSNLTIEPRLGRRKRCLDWCPCNVYCNEFHKYMKEVDPTHDKTKR